MPWAFMRARFGGSSSTHSTSLTKRTLTAPKPTEVVARNFLPGSTISSFSRPGAHLETLFGSVRKSQTFCAGRLDRDGAVEVHGGLNTRREPGVLSGGSTPPTGAEGDVRHQYAGEGPRRPADLLRVGQEDLLERRRVGHRRVGRGDAHERAVEVLEAALGEHGGDLGADAAGARGLVEEDRLVRLRDGLEDGLLVHREERAQVHDLGVDALGLERLRGLERGPDHRAVGDDREVAARRGARRPCRSARRSPPAGSSSLMRR